MVANFPFSVQKKSLQQLTDCWLLSPDKWKPPAAIVGYDMKEKEQMCPALQLWTFLMNINSILYLSSVKRSMSFRDAFMQTRCMKAGADGGWRKKKHSPYQPVSCSSRGSPSCTLWQNAPTHVFDPCRRQCAWIWKGKRNERMDFIQRCVSFQKKFSKSNLSKEQIKY